MGRGGSGCALGHVVDVVVVVVDVMVVGFFISQAQDIGLLADRLELELAFQFHRSSSLNLQRAL